jgi:uncharacterized protein (TIGR03000 family)
MPSSRTARTSWRLVLAVACGVLPALPATAQEMRPIFFDVILPAGATLEIDGYLTRSTGASRSFETPPVAAGRTYAYSIKAVAGGKQVTKKIQLRPEEHSVIDLRPDFAAAAAAIATLPTPMPRPEPKPQPKPEPKPEPKPQPKPEPKNELDRPGFVTVLEKDGERQRLWVFRAGSKELDAYKKSGELERHVTRIKAGPRGMTVRAPDGETLDAYLKALDQK